MVVETHLVGVAEAGLVGEDGGEVGMGEVRARDVVEGTVEAVVDWEDSFLSHLHSMQQ